MSDKVPISKRKIPRQKRSQSVVDAILAATTQILKNVGYEAATTNTIAEKAGVSIGSLYQYFSNKPSLVATLIDRQIEKMTQEFEDKVEECRKLPLDTAIGILVRHSIGLFLGDRLKTRAIFILAPELDRLPSLFTARRRIVASVLSLLDPHRKLLKPADPGVAAFVVVNSLMGVVLTMMYDETQTHTNEALIHELTQMIRGHLISDKDSGTR